MSNFLDLARSLPPWVLLGFGVLTGSLRTAWSFLYSHTIGYAIARLTLSLTVEDIEHWDAYLWLSHWVETHLRRRRVNSLLLRRSDRRGLPEDEEHQAYRLIPAYGTYYMRWRKRLAVVSHLKETQPSSQRAKYAHTMSIQIWFAWDRSLLLDILNEARAQYLASLPPTIDFYRADQFGDWRLDTIAPRSLNSVYLPPEQLEDITADIATFLSARDVYTELAIPYRRGYQLAGPPGTGKSTLILALASRFNLPVYSVSLGSAELTGYHLSELLSSCRKPSLVAFEDIDRIAAANAATPVKTKSKTRASLSAADLLNAIDGIGAGEDRLLF